MNLKEEHPMAITVRPIIKSDLPDLARIWNQVVEEGQAFPQETPLTKEEAETFFFSQSACEAAVNDKEEIVGLYILHPNNVGRCGHIANASYAVDKACRGQHIGEALVKACMARGKELNFRILQFNAVVASNAVARHLYKHLGFTELGTIPGGFRAKDGSYLDIVLYYHSLL
jgi:L-amino acid N-acyltransferase YncA